MLNAVFAGNILSLLNELERSKDLSAPDDDSPLRLVVATQIDDVAGPTGHNKARRKWQE